MITKEVTINPWHVETCPLRKRHLGKTLEELGELTAVVARCMIQGIDEVDPSSGKTNRLRLEEELSDVHAQMIMLEELFKLDPYFITERSLQKKLYMRRWNELLIKQGRENANETNPI